MLRTFWNDEDGFLISAELVLVATVLVLGLIVGLIELQSAIIHEMDDIACAIGSLNQSFSFPGTTTVKGVHTIFVSGSSFTDFRDECDCSQCQSLFCTPPTPETPHTLPGGG